MTIELASLAMIAVAIIAFLTGFRAGYHQCCDDHERGWNEKDRR